MGCPLWDCILAIFGKLKPQDDDDARTYETSYFFTTEDNTLISNSAWGVPKHQYTKHFFTKPSYSNIRQWITTDLNLSQERIHEPFAPWGVSNVSPPASCPANRGIQRPHQLPSHLRRVGQCGTTLPRPRNYWKLHPQDTVVIGVLRVHSMSRLSCMLVISLLINGISLLIFFFRFRWTYTRSFCHSSMIYAHLKVEEQDIWPHCDRIVGSIFV